MIFHTKIPHEVPNDVIMYHEKRIEWNILISACMPYVQMMVYVCRTAFIYSEDSPYILIIIICKTKLGLVNWTVNVLSTSYTLS